MGWFRQLFTRRRRYDELSESIREHLEEKIADLTDGGMTRDEAESRSTRVRQCDFDRRAQPRGLAMANAGIHVFTRQITQFDKCAKRPVSALL